ncbi:DUF2950 domain-containing protein [Nguyenibacter sp. L1]|uniref:DUF2950 domain-containing protein n=1 Tax=Nguyenibacter sp. L1 TaxID=3049350 RepID=UPI002B47AE9C|nr:DUF2950 domain-containing protein [Nguyenibacter sp. L1]WRH87006.1 DUF2950 domain-containing protein [Nguyenibacter sp. L1]
MMGTSLRRRLAIIPLVLPLFAAAPAATGEYFATPEAAIMALVLGARADDRDELRTVFGEAGLRAISSGDPAADRAGENRFVAAYDAGHTIAIHDGTAILSIGADQWPFPIPLTHSQHGWSFDVPAGLDEILDRRIGANELYTQQVMLAYVDAQYEYAQGLHDGRKVHVYAQRLLSSPGKQDGLYWPTEEGQPPSPLGPLVAEAYAGGYHPGGTGKPQPYHGYFFRVLTAQGPHARGGAYDYIADGLMLGGFGLVAWPVRWGNSGVMTFIVNQDGEIYAKDLGPDTPALGSAMTRFDPDPTWQKIGAPAPIAGQAGDEGG